MTNKSLKFLFALPLVALPVSIMAQPVFTDPVGAVSVEVNGLQALSHPFQKAKSYQGVVGPNPGTSVALSNVPALSGQYYLQVLSGAAAGQVASLVASTSSSVTLDGAIDGLAEGDSVAIRAHVTLGDIAASIAGGVEDSTTITLYNLDGSFSSFEAFSGTWFDDSFNPVDDVVVYPGEGFVLGLPSSESMTFVGSVSVDPVVVPVPASVSFVGSLNPVPSVSNPSSLGQIFGSLDEGSTLTIYTTEGSLLIAESFESFGGSWFDADFSVVDSFSYAAPASVAVFGSGPGVATLPPAFTQP